MVTNFKEKRKELEQKNPEIKERYQERRKNTTQEELYKNFTIIKNKNLFEITEQNIVIINEENFKQLVLNYIFYKLWIFDYKKMIKEENTWPLYLAELITNIILEKNNWKKILEDPYVFNWINKEDYKTAWDTASFWFLIFYKKRKNLLKKDDYLGLAYVCYSNYYWWNFASNIINTLEKVEKIWPDLIKRPFLV